MVDYKKIFCGNEADVMNDVIMQIEKNNISAEVLSVIFLKATWFFNQNAKKEMDNKIWVQILKKIRPLFVKVKPDELNEIANSLQLQVNTNEKNNAVDYMECINNLVRIARVESKNAA